MLRRRIAPLAVAAVTVAAVATGGCATRKYTRTQVADSEARAAERIDGIETLIEESQDRLQDHERRLSEQRTEMGELSKTAQEALDRAVAAGKLAQGRLVYERVLSDESVRFGFDRAELSSEAMATLDAFAEELVAREAGVYIEIQGHTDSVGSESYNLGLGAARAEAVRRYLNQRHGIPLHRTSVISYGESEPVADNGTFEGRAANRRVALVVLE